MKPGIYRSISNENYHGGPGVSKSGLDLIARSPAHFHAAMTSANDNESTAAQQLGTAFHALVLEPAEFAKQYTLALRQQDLPDAIADRDTLVAMVAKLNETRQPKLATSGTKPEMIARILGAERDLPEELRSPQEALEKAKLADLKAMIDAFNELRPGLLSDRGTMQELAELLRANGVPVTLWADVKAQWLENNGHRTVLTQETWEQLQAMRASVMAHPAASRLLNHPGHAETSVYWIDQGTGELCRCRPDFWRTDGVIVDLKTTDDASPEGFRKSIANWRYHVQAPFYMDGITAAIEQTADDMAGGFPVDEFSKPVAFVFVAVEKKAPYAVGVYVLEQASMDIGRAQYRNDLSVYAVCRASDHWPAYGDKIQPISLPEWHIKQNAHLLDVA